MTEQNIPYGYCHCGCGQLAPIATRNRHERGQVKGQPVRYIAKHFGPKYPPLEDRLWANTVKTETCWLWQGGKLSTGYGEITLGDKTMLTHRLSYELHHGPIPEGMEVCHSCDRPSCINPAHLFLGTHADNMHDMKQKGRQVHEPASYMKGEQVHTAKLTTEQVKEIRRLYSEQSTPYDTLCGMFGVKKSAISAIITRRSWKHIQT